MAKPLSRTVSTAGGWKQSGQRNSPVWRMTVPPSLQPSFCHTALYHPDHLEQFLWVILPKEGTGGPDIITHSCSKATITKHRKLDGFEEWKFVLSQSWRPEVQDQGVSRAMPPLKPLENLSFWRFASSLWHASACRCITPTHHLPRASCLGVCVFTRTSVILDWAQSTPVWHHPN